MKQELGRYLVALEKSVPKSDAEREWLGYQDASIKWERQPKPTLHEPEVWRALVAARTADDLRRVWQQSKRWLNPKWGGRPYVQDLYEHAEQLIRAKRDPYYPRRDLADEKRVTFFARAMAGISLGISPITAVHRLRKMKHGPKCCCVHCDTEHSERVYKVMYSDLIANEKRRKMK